MRQNLSVWLIGILVVTLMAGYVDLSNSIGIGDWSRNTETKLGLDLKGGLQLVLQAEPVGDTPITSDQLEAARNILEDRANGTGAAEPVVQTAEGNRILVELPGITNLEDARRVIQETAFLEIIDGGDTQLTQGELVCTSLGCPRPEQLRQTSLTPTAGAATAVVTGTAQITGTAQVTATQATGATAVSTIVAATTVTATGTTTATVAAPTAVPTPSKIWTTIVRGNDIDGSKVAVQFDSTSNQPEVAFTLKGQAGTDFCNFSTANVGKFMPILLDKKVISAPVIQQAICGGSGVINGLTLSEARILAQQLKYGALPVSLTLQSERKISATLGQEAIDKSIVAGAVGLGMVVLFMIVYYRLPGALASLALVIYSVITYAVFKLVPVTLTLAGIAGFILSIGMAVDANVLIFARLKEELRSGKTLGAAVEAGFDHAWPSIRDSNASTLITCAILFWFGSTFGGASIIKGFALTLAIGVIVSLFSAITVTRTFLRAIVKTNLAKNRWAFNLETSKQAASAATTTEA
ncbi:MAG TPA: protein translocase subunit SecD [Chloroflexia bacterium]|nr:protein translocase subunit SecD [Chloroflexia bacterium]